MFDKEQMAQYLRDIRDGERARILFDLLMETIGAPHDVTKAGLFDLMKAKIEAETEAISKLMPPKKSAKLRKIR